jgi:hypothetical protein
MIQVLEILGILLLACAVNATIDKHTIKVLNKQPNHTLNAEIYTGIALVLAVLFVTIHKLSVWDIFWIIAMAWCWRALAFNIILSLLRGLPWDYKSPALNTTPSTGTSDPNSKTDEVINSIEKTFGLDQKTVYLGEAALTVVFALIVAIK